MRKRRYYTYAKPGASTRGGERFATVDAETRSAEHESREDHARRSFPATFRRLYISRDRKLSVFEDGRGHLAAVRTARLA